MTVSSQPFITAFLFLKRNVKKIVIFLFPCFFFKCGVVGGDIVVVVHLYVYANSFL